MSDDDIDVEYILKKALYCYEMANKREDILRVCGKLADFYHENPDKSASIPTKLQIAWYLAGSDFYESVLPLLTLITPPTQKR